MALLDLLGRRAELPEAQIVDVADEGYALTADGKKLLELLLPLSKWAANWAKRLVAKMK